MDAGNSAPQFGPATVMPGSPRTDDLLTFSASVTDADGDQVTVAYEWRRNGVLVAGQTARTLPATVTSKNDVVSVRATASDGRSSASVEASTTILDSPPTITGTLPTSLTNGATLTYALQGSDPDDDPIGPFELLHGPAGFAISDVGGVTWTPRGPLFGAETDFNWGVRLRDHPTTVLTGTIRLNDPARAAPLHVPPTPSSSRGFLGGALAKLSSGVSRLVFAAGDVDGVRAIALDPRIGGIVESPILDGPLASWALSEFYGFAAPLVNDYDADANDEVWVCSPGASGASVLAYDFAADSVEWSTPPAVGEICIALAEADVTGDRRPEIIVMTFADPSVGRYDSTVYIYDAFNRSLVWKSPALYGVARDMTVADVDGDGGLEIVAATISRAHLFRRTGPGPESYAETASVDIHNVRNVLVADTKGDGVPEIYVLHGGGVKSLDGIHCVREPIVWPGCQEVVDVYDATLQLKRTLVATFGSRLELERSSFSRKNLLLGTQPYVDTSQVGAIDPLTGAPIWQSPPLEGQLSLNSLWFIDSDGDGEDEISVGTTCYRCGSQGKESSIYKTR